MEKPSLLAQFGPGLHTDIPPEAYYRRVRGEANKGALTIADRSLAHYDAWVQCEDDTTSTDTFRFGQALHCALLEPAAYPHRYRVMPDFGPQNSSANRAKVALWKERNADVTPLLERDAELIENMVTSAREHPKAGIYLEHGVTEATAVWHDDEWGLDCKARFDHINTEHLFALDPKTCADASESAFERAVHNYGYHIQQAHYCRGAAAVGYPLRHFLFLCIEKDPLAPSGPGARRHAVAVYPLEAPWEERGWELRQRGMAALSRGMRENRWPSYNNDEVKPLRMPAFAFYD